MKIVAHIVYVTHNYIFMGNRLYLNVRYSV